jgi:hypothetical protein
MSNYRTSETAYTPMKELFKTKLATKKFVITITSFIYIILNIFPFYFLNKIINIRIENLTKNQIVKTIVEEKVERIVVKEEMHDLCRDSIIEWDKDSIYKCEHPSHTMVVERYRNTFIQCICPKKQKE